MNIPRLEYDEMTSISPAESSEQILKRVESARVIQQIRLQKFGIFSNSQMSRKQIKATCSMNVGAQDILKNAFNKMGLSARGYDRIIKVARTIADLDGADIVQEPHIAEAIHYRNSLQEMNP